MAKKCGSKWELGKMDRALIRMWQKSVGLNGNILPMDRALIRMWQKVWVLLGTWQKCEGLIKPSNSFLGARDYARSAVASLTSSKGSFPYLLYNNQVLTDADSQKEASNCGR